MSIELVERCKWCGNTITKLPNGIWAHYYENLGFTHNICHPEMSMSTAATPGDATIRLDTAPQNTDIYRLRTRVEVLENRVCVLEDEFDKMRGGYDGHLDDNLPSDSQHD
jgi:hypothetical protein